MRSIPAISKRKEKGPCRSRDRRARVDGRYGEAERQPHHTDLRLRWRTVSARRALPGQAGAAGARTGNRVRAAGCWDRTWSVRHQHGTGCGRLLVRVWFMEADGSSSQESEAEARQKHAPGGDRCGERAASLQGADSSGSSTSTDSSSGSTSPPASSNPPAGDPDRPTLRRRSDSPASAAPGASASSGMPRHPRCHSAGPIQTGHTWLTASKRRRTKFSLRSSPEFPPGCSK